MYSFSSLKKPCSVLALLAALLLVAAAPAGAAWISTGGNEGASVEVRLLESSADRVVIEYTVPGFEASPVTIDGRTYQAISLPGEGKLLQAGMPELPHVARSIIIPDAARMRARVIGMETAEFPGLPVVPSKGNLLRTVDPATVAYTFDPFYGSTAEFPKERAQAGEPYILRDYRGLVVDAFPITVTGQGTIRVATRLTIEVAADGFDGTNALSRGGPPERVVPEFDEIYQSRFLNYGRDRYTPVLERGSMLIITYDAFHAAMQPLVDWKRQSGIPTTIVDISAIGNTSTAIKSYIQVAYNQGGLAFVLLVGDAAQIATPNAAGGASDPTYALLAGTDRYPEVLIGRFSAETVAHVQTQVERTIGYEKTPATGANWYREGTGVASDQGPGDDNEYDYVHMNAIRSKLLPYGYSLIDQIYDPSATAAMVTAALNNGRGIVNYTGHGSMTSWGTTGFSNNNVSALQNDWMLPFIFSVACVNGQFDGGTCFAEVWLRSVRGTNPIGAVGAYMSSINQSWNPPMCAEDASDDLLVNGQAFTFGGLCFNGSCQMMDEYGAVDGGDMFLTWHIFGDPSLLVRTKVPVALDVQHDGTMILGQSEYAVTVPGVAEARCALYANGVLYGAAYTDAAGAATISLDPLPPEPMTLTLTVTAPNGIPQIVPVEVSPGEGAFLVHAGSVIGDRLGDADGAGDAGETVTLSVSLRNAGVAPASGVTAVLLSGDPYVEITPRDVVFGDIGAGETAAGQDPWIVHFLTECPDNHAVAFTIQATSAEGSWTRAFSILVGAPALSCADQVIDDSPAQGGNGNAWITPSEAFQVVLTLANAGHANARNATVSVIDAGPYLQVVKGTASVGNIAAGGQAVLSGLNFVVSAECPVPTVLTVQAAITADFGYAGTLQFSIPVGGLVDDCEQNRGWTLGAPGDDATTGLWVLADPVGTVYNTQVAQPEDDHTPAPGVQCFVTGNGAIGGAAGDSDVDGGKTTLVSPVFELGHVAGAQVHYWFWYTNDLGNNPGADYWTVQVTADGTNWVNLERTTASTDAWAERTFQLRDFVTLTDRVQLRFIAEDLAPGTLVEALVDDFTLIVEEAAAGVSAPVPVTGFALQRIAPNPTRDAAQVHFAVPAPTKLQLEIFDVSGRLVRTLLQGSVEAGEHAVAWDGRNGGGRRAGAGVYFVRLSAPGFSQVRTVTLLD
jgi:hypothetical protein